MTRRKYIRIWKFKLTPLELIIVIASILFILANIFPLSSPMTIADDITKASRIGIGIIASIFIGIILTAFMSSVAYERGKKRR